jgi:hypothetical protein
MKKIVLGILVVLVAAYIIFDKVKDAGLSKEFTQKQDSLTHAVDSMKLTLAIDSVKIDSLIQVDLALVDEVKHAKGKVIKIVEVIAFEKNKIDSYSEQELVGSFNQRYPIDTVTAPLPLATPVLISAAKDLVEFDGIKQMLPIKDSIIALTEARVNGKDSVIAVYVKKEGTYKSIMFNQDTQIKDWKNQYQSLYIQNQSLKFKNKITKIGAGIVVGGLVYLMIAK